MKAVSKPMPEGSFGSERCVERFMVGQDEKKSSLKEARRYKEVN